MCVFYSFWIFLFDFFGGSLLCFTSPPPPLTPSSPILLFWDQRKKKKKKKTFFSLPPEFFLWDWACKGKKNVKCYVTCSLLSSILVLALCYAKIEKKKNSHEPTTIKPASTFRCDLWVWPSDAKFESLVCHLKTHSHLMHYYACYFVLATMNYNCFKDFMERDIILIKKKKPACWTCTV